ncbi:hypothetical protein GW17_00048809 [Ensete ventricosum]|nr:hypothetical protein GW17_00048809 [Ensete ventricosum]
MDLLWEEDHHCHRRRRAPLLLVPTVISSTIASSAESTCKGPPPIISRCSTERAQYGGAFELLPRQLPPPPSDSSLSASFTGMNIMGMKKAIAARAPYPEVPCPATESTIKKALSTEVRPPLKRLKKVGDSIILTKEASPLVGDKPLKARWASLTPRSKLWVDGGDAQLFYQGILNLPLAKDIYTTPSEVLVENAGKNLVIHGKAIVSLFLQQSSLWLTNEFCK